MNSYTNEGCATVGVAAAFGRRGYGLRYEYRSPIAINGWPLLHISFGNDPVTCRPRIARGIIAIGNVALGVFAIGGAAFGVFTVGGFSLGLAAAIGGVALGAGLSIGGLAVGAVAFGGLAIGFHYAVGGAAFGPAVIDGRRCDQAVLDVAKEWLRRLPNACR